MYYFAYGSNMSLARLRARTPSAQFVGCYQLPKHDLRFHMASGDGSGKCDAHHTGNPLDVLHGGVFTINPAEKGALDIAESLGVGYDEKWLHVTADDGSTLEALLYTALIIEQDRQPYSWYHNHVLVGAREVQLPNQYIEHKIRAVACIEDDNAQRDRLEWAIHQ